MNRKVKLHLSYIAVPVILSLIVCGCSTIEEEKAVKRIDNVLISVDFNALTGNKIKPLHGVNNSPISLTKPIPELRDAGIPFVRLHDTGGAYGRSVFVDVPNIFPDFDADENDPENYHFEFTDACIRQLIASGSQVFYRLGVTIENNYKFRALNIYPPKDFAKWARICEHIIRHYNEGWANGFKYNIQYWEIWNEPENLPMWLGTKEQFFEFYKVSSRYLKDKFPHLSIGGFGSCGFYDISEPGRGGERFSGFVTYAREFIEFCAKEKLPLDFFSWHRYFADPDHLIPEAKYVRELLDKNGFTETESIFDEWNYVDWYSHFQWDDLKSEEGASKCAHLLLRLQQLPVDKAMYYAATPNSGYGGWYYFPSQKLTRTYYAFKAFNALYKLKNEVKTVVSNNKIVAAAAADGDQRALMISNSSMEEFKIKLDKEAFSGKAEVYMISKEHIFDKVDFSDEFIMPGRSVILIELNSAGQKKGKSVDIKGNFAGLDGVDNK